MRFPSKRTARRAVTRNEDVHQTPPVLASTAPPRTSTGASGAPMRPAAALLVGITLLLGACAGMDTAPPPAPQDRPATAQEQATAAFYLQYAVLAADVYTSETELQMQVVRSLSSPLITGDNA